jgi:hypothetical protein
MKIVQSSLKGSKILPDIDRSFFIYRHPDILRRHLIAPSTRKPATVENPYVFVSVIDGKFRDININLSM